MAFAENTELIEAFKEFYRNYYRDEIAELAQGYPTEEKSLHIDWRDLYRFDMDLADDFRTQPQQLKEYAEEALRVYDLPVDVSLGQANVRIRNLPDTVPISDIRADHRGNLIAIQGAIREMTPVLPEATNTAFECQRCGTLTRIPNQGGEFQEPHECPGCERSGPFRINMDQTEYINTQKIRVQELPGGYDESDTPPRTEIRVEDDLAGQFSVGDRVTVTGIVKLNQRGTERNPSSRFDTYLYGSDIEEAYETYPEIDITQDDKQRINELAGEDDLFEQFVDSLAPSVEGHKWLKSAIVLQLFGGVTKVFPDGAKSRGNIHALVVSDPGKAMSRLIDRSSRFAPRAVSVSGTDTSKAALTAPATASSNAPGEDPWEIKAGVTVMADKGLLCIDNLDELDEGALSALASVLENQEVKASKASQKKTFPARASVLAAGAPKYGRFDEFEPIGEQIDLAPQLVSNFDLIFTSVDSVEEDAETAEHLLNLSQVVESEAKSSGLVNEDNVDPAKDYEDYAPAIDEEEFRKYVVYARENCHPTLTDAAKEALKDFYTDVRSRGDDMDAAVPVSAQKLESMVRLAEASARTRLSSTVEKADAERVIDIVEASLEDVGVDPETGEFDADVVETGTSEEPRERIENIKGLIADLESEDDRGAPKELVIERAEATGLSPDKIEVELDSLFQKGEIYEPVTDFLRTT